MYACISNKNHEPSTTENFSFSPMGCTFSVPPLHFKSRSNPTVAINPQDIILNKNPRTFHSNNIINNQIERHLFETAINPPTYYNETDLPLYLNFSDILFNDSPMFSIPCSEETFSSSSSICSIPTRRSSTITFEEQISLPPSAAILQSELNKSSLDYFIQNNSFIEEIRSSIPEEQQQYINSGIASPFGVTIPSTVNEKTYDLISSTDCTNLFLNSTITYDDVFDEDNQSLTMDYTKEEQNSTKEESRLSSLLSKLNNFNRRQRYDHHLLNTFEEIKTNYDSEINLVFKYKDTLLNNLIQKPDKLYTSIFKAYEKANLKIENTKSMNKEGSTNVQNKKRKPCDTRTKRVYYNLQDKYEKKTRKNYNQDVVNTLMDWYLNNNGKTPTNKDKIKLTQITGKSIIQISTWFQNAKRRYQKKLDLYQSLSSKHPTTVFDTKSFIKYLEVNKKDY